MRNKLVFDKNSVKTPKVASGSGKKFGRIVIGMVALCILMFLCFVGVVMVVVDKESLAKQFYMTMEELTGSTVMSEKVTMNVFPVPTVVLHNFVVANDPNSAEENMLQVERVEVALSFATLKDTKTPHFGTVKLINPVLHLETYQSGKNNWGFLHKEGVVSNSKLRVKRLIIQGAQVIYNDMYLGINREFLDIKLDAAIKNSLAELKADFQFDGEAISLDGSVDLKNIHDFAHYGADMNMHVKRAVGDLAYQGKIALLDGMFSWDGKMSLKATDIAAWLKLVMDERRKGSVFEYLTVPIAATIDLDLAAQDKVQKLSNISIVSGDNQLGGDVTLDRSAAKVFVDVALNSKKLALSQLLPKDSGGFSGDALGALLHGAFADDVAAHVEIAADGLSVRDGIAGKLTLSGDLDGGEFIISQGRYDLKGAVAQFFGIAKIDAQQNVSFQGNLDMKGDKFVDFASANGFAGVANVTNYNEAFGLKSTLSVSRVQTILSDLALLAGPFEVKGGLNVESGDSVTVQGGLDIKGADLDRLEAFLRANNVAKEKVAFENAPVYFDWLHDLQSRVAVNVELNNYIYNKKTFPLGKLGVQALTDKIKLVRMDVPLGDMTVKGDFDYSQAEDRPVIKASLDIDKVDISKFSGKARVINPVPQGNRQQIWSKEVFAVAALQRFDGEISLKVEHLTHSFFDMEKANIELAVKEGNWEIKTLEGYLWGGSLQAQGVLSLSAISAISIAFTLQELPAEKLLDMVAGLHGLAGPVTLSGQFAANGLNLADWIASSKGAISFNGHENTIKGFDLKSLVAVMPSVRTITDVNTQARNAILKGETFVDTIEGSFSLDQGSLRTSELKMRSRDAVSTVSGSIDLNTWMIDLAMQMKILTLARGDFPIVGLFFRDSVDQPISDLDTKDLESFVARRQTQQQVPAE